MRLIFPLLVALWSLVLFSCVWFAYPAFGGDTLRLLSTTVQIGPTTAKGALAEVVFNNRSVNGPGHNGSYLIEWHNIAIEVEFTWNANAGGEDAITVYTPPGLIQVPMSIDVSEEDVGKILIYPMSGVSS